MKRQEAIFIGLSICIGLSAQKIQGVDAELSKLIPGSRSNIVKVFSSDTVVVKLEMRGVQYDPALNFLPYYLLSKSTAYEMSAVPKLKVKQVSKVTGPALSVIQKYYDKYIGAEFEMKAMASLCLNENRNVFHLVPFRKNTSGEIEELLDYGLEWDLVNGDAVLRSNKTNTFKTSSILSSGTWYKIAVAKDGMHKINKTFLSNCGIDAETIDPASIRIYGNGGLMLNEMNSAFRYDDLEENDILVKGEADGKFDDGDYILFYGKGTGQWEKRYGNGLKFVLNRNIYSDTSYYYICTDLGPGKRMTSKATLGAANATTATYDYHDYHELNQVNFVKSGRHFFGEYFDINNAYTFTFPAGDFVLDSLFSEVSLVGRNNAETFFEVQGNGLNFLMSTPSVDINYYLASYAAFGFGSQSCINTNPSAINISVTKKTAAAIGWMDRITVNARRNLVLRDQLLFRDNRVCSPGKIANYQLSNRQAEVPQIWNVTDHIHPYNQEYLTVQNQVSFTAPADSLQEYCAATEKNFLTPSFISKIENQNLHAIQQADYVIVTHPLFTEQSKRLAELHQEREGLTYAIATTEQIYNEFSSGLRDPSAIRDFIRMLYSRNISSGRQPRYALLFGDASYFLNRHDASNLIPAYETEESLSPITSIASDDFFGLMDPNEGFNATSNGLMDIGIGRIPVSDPGQASNIVTKIENYYSRDDNFKVEDQADNCSGVSSSPWGEWRNNLIFLADDEDHSEHQWMADSIANMVERSKPVFNIEKVYIDAFVQTSTPGGQRYPDAHEQLQRKIKKGALIFNYTGHGGEVGLTGERLVDIETINNWDNFGKLPLFITATCEFTRYDDPGRTSAGELCLLNPRGGALALMTTCRVAFSTFNLDLNKAIFNHIFESLPGGKKPALGDMIRRTKLQLSQQQPYANFHLMGDPAVTLAFPSEKFVLTKTINQKPAGDTLINKTVTDTISALEKVSVSGCLVDAEGKKISDFNGLLYATVFDKASRVTCLLNDESSDYQTSGRPFSFWLQNNVLYRGKAEVRNGDFNFSFMVPKDIAFNYGTGKFSYYATNGREDAAGYFKKFAIGGGRESAQTDGEGPMVNLYMNEKNFVNGGTTSEKPVFYAQLTDSSGINMLGTSLGHDISAVLDGNASKPLILNDYYEAALNSYQSGKVRYPFESLSEGEHRLSFKVWDIQNNSSLSEIDFVVAKSEELVLKHVLNYPNPLTSHTSFFIEHNQACDPMKVDVQIFTVSGKLVKTIHRAVNCEGYRLAGIEWDAKDDYGDKLGRGVYLYRVSVTTADNKKAEKIEKLVILN